MKTKYRNLDANIGKLIQQEQNDLLSQQPKTTEARIKSLEEQIFNL